MTMRIRVLLTLCALLIGLTGASLSAQLTYTQFAVAAGSVLLDGSNPTSVTTGLKEIRSCTANIITSDWLPTTGGEPVVLSVVPHATAGRLDIYAWVDGDPPSASTSSAFYVSYICIGIV